MGLDTVFRLEQGEKIGEGAFGLVYRARESDSGQIVALKKSRVSLQVKRTVLNYEARILHLLAGHPSIPTVFAYGRLAHFEYMSMELLGPSLSDVLNEQGKLSLSIVVKVASQMLSVLEHIHKSGLVHRDIKPHNILFQMNSPDIVRLIDFGIARPRLADNLAPRDAPSRTCVVGTLQWASLHAHYGVDLNPRDDLESLAYTLLHLLRGNLPWNSLCVHGSEYGREVQVRERKRVWNGSRLSQGCPVEFGQLLDYARMLGFNDPIDYTHHQDRLQHLPQFSVDDICCTNSESSQILKYTQRPTKGNSPVEVGQLIYVKVMARTSIEGHSLQGLDPWHDPALSSAEWNTIARPAVVVDMEFDNVSSLYKIQVVSLGNGAPAKSGKPARNVASPLSVQSESIVLKPAWPNTDSYFYAFPRAPWFYCLPSPTPAHAHWMVDSAGVQHLREKFGVPFPMNFIEKRIRNAVKRYETQMVMQDAQVFVDVWALTPSNVDPISESGFTDWRGDRGWFDECVRIARQRGLDDGYCGWTGAMGGSNSDSNNSYCGSDFSLWQNCQRERDDALTLGSRENLDMRCNDDSLAKILEVSESLGELAI